MPDPLALLNPQQEEVGNCSRSDLAGLLDERSLALSYRVPNPFITVFPKQSQAVFKDVTNCVDVEVVRSFRDADDLMQRMQAANSRRIAIRPSGRTLARLGHVRSLVDLAATIEKANPDLKTLVPAGMYGTQPPLLWVVEREP